MSVRRFRPATSLLRRPRTRAQAMAEFAIILPVLMLLLVVAVDFGRLFFSYIQINNGAREGAAWGSQSPTDCTASPCLAVDKITIHARQETNAQAQRGESPIQVFATCADPGGTAIACTKAPAGAGIGNTITVNVREPFTFLTPFIGNIFGGGLQMNASATAAVTGYAAGIGGVPPPPCTSLPTAFFTVVTDSTLAITTDPSGSTPDSGVCNISGYNWTWGDGNDEPGNATAASHTYLSAGTYSVMLEVTNQAGANSMTLTVTVPQPPPPPVCAKPTANFTAIKNKKVYTYTDTSTVADPVNCPITDWLWTFDDGNQSNAQNPTYTYGSANNHTATLKVTNAGGSATVGPK